MFLKFPLWHFIGNKVATWPWINKHINNFNFETVLDIFGGSGAISHGFQLLNKHVVYNEILEFLLFSQKGILGNYLFETLPLEKTGYFWEKHQPENYVLDYYSNLYFFEKETKLIDNVIQNILTAEITEAQRGLAFYALCQACLEKRPFNTFQNSHLRMRLKNNMSLKPQSWDFSFKIIFKNSLANANSFIDHISMLKLPKIKITNIPSSEITPSVIPLNQIDLVYLDPPFISGKKKSKRFADYVDNYHVLEALANYNSYFKTWIDEENALYKSKQEYPPNKYNQSWLDPINIPFELENLIKKFTESIIVFSYRENSHVNIDLLIQLFESYFNKVEFFQQSHLYLTPLKPPKFNDILIIARN